MGDSGTSHPPTHSPMFSIQTPTHPPTHPGLKLRGVPARPPIGYLTHLEALRYVQVGTHYKTPLYPIWVVGSSSHFTVLFSMDKGKPYPPPPFTVPHSLIQTTFHPRTHSSFFKPPFLKTPTHPPTHPLNQNTKGCNEESAGEQLLARVQRVFQSHDPSEGGFIQIADLQQGPSSHPTTNPPTHPPTHHIFLLVLVLYPNTVLIEPDLLAVALDEGEME